MYIKELLGEFKQMFSGKPKRHPDFKGKETYMLKAEYILIKFSDGTTRNFEELIKELQNNNIKENTK
jgi:hypothetical protein